MTYSTKCEREEIEICSLFFCKNSNNYTIKPNIIIEKYPLKEIKENIKPGSIIAIKINDTLTKELGLIINYINSKGYQIVNLSEHLSE